MLKQYLEKLRSSSKIPRAIKTSSPTSQVKLTDLVTEERRQPRKKPYDRE